MPAAFCQNYGTVTGLVVGADSQPLAKATVSIVAVVDSTVLSYALTDDVGGFKLIRISAQRDLALYITHVNSSPFHREIRLAPKEDLAFDTIRMMGNSLDYSELAQYGGMKRGSSLFVSLS